MKKIVILFFLIILPILANEENKNNNEETKDQNKTIKISSPTIEEQKEPVEKNAEIKNEKMMPNPSHPNDPFYGGGYRDPLNCPMKDVPGHNSSNCSGCGPK